MHMTCIMGTVWQVAVGVHRYPLCGPGKRKLVLRDTPPLNWRAMLGDSMTCEVPEPMVEFQLFETGGRSWWLKAKSGQMLKCFLGPAGVTGA